MKLLPWLLIVACCACSGPSAPTLAPAPSPTVAPVPTPYGAVATFRGSGTKNTDPFTLVAGDYKAGWEVADSVGSCSLVVSLQSPNTPTFYRDVFRVTLARDGQVDGGSLYNIPADTYYFAVQSTCEVWVIAMVPQP